MRMRRLRLPTSNEERVAKNIGKLLSDYSLDLEQVGKYLVVANPHLIYSRALEVLESAQFNKEIAEYNEMGKYYDEKLF
jgi:hypothetical protein